MERKGKYIIAAPVIRFVSHVKQARRKGRTLPTKAKLESQPPNEFAMVPPRAVMPRFPEPSPADSLSTCSFDARSGVILYIAAMSSGP